MSNSTTKKHGAPDLDRLRKENPKLFKAVAESQYEMMELLNARTGQVKFAGKVRYIDTTDAKLALYSEADMAALLSHLKVLNWSGDEMPAFRWWLAQEDRRQFSDIVFEPDRKSAPANALNTFRGFRIAPKAKPDGWSILRDHLLRNVCNGDQEHFEYILDWSAHLWQRPGAKIGTAIVLQGDKGCGKTIFSNILADCIGPEFCPIVDTPDTLAGRFNGHLANAILIRAEEALHARDPRLESRLKVLITSPRILIERKGYDCTEVDSKSNLLMTSNKAHIVNATAAERRFFVLRCGNGNIQDSNFFAGLMAQMKDGGYGAFVHDLLHRDISRRDFSRPPLTSVLSRQIVESFTGLERWWCAALATGTLPVTRDAAYSIDDLEWPTSGRWTTPKAAVQESANAYARAFDGPPSPSSVGKFLLGVVPGLQRGRRQEGGVREQTYLLPSLDDCRASFVAAYPGLRLEDVSDLIPEATTDMQPARERVVAFRAA